MMNIPLKPDSERFVEDQMKGGRYESPEEVVHAALKLLEERQASFAQVRGKIALGLEQAKRGELVDGEEALDAIFGPLDPSANSG